MPLLLFTPSPAIRRPQTDVKVIRFSSTIAATLESQLRPLYLDGWRPRIYGNGMLILEKES